MQLTFCFAIFFLVVWAKWSKCKGLSEWEDLILIYYHWTASCMVSVMLDKPFSLLCT